ncbi:MAG: nucleoside triphosphate pyrophosphohydrolase [Candidatus Latescibacterota bacterium]
MEETSNFEELVRVMKRLRAPEGCPWDREQTHSSLKPYMLEEVYEALEAIDAEDDSELCKELGDVLLQVVFHAQIAEEEDRFTIEDVAGAIVEKLVRRHPHVFADAEVDSTEHVIANWEEIKKQERRDAGQQNPSHLDGIPKSLPALMRAQRMQARAARQGFDWREVGGALDKVEEEFAELRRENEEGSTDTVEAELGDLLFSLVNVSRFLHVDPEQALQRAIAKFEKRFRSVESALREREQSMRNSTLEELDALWDEAKKHE